MPQVSFNTNQILLIKPKYGLSEQYFLGEKIAKYPLKNYLSFGNAAGPRRQGLVQNDQRRIVVAIEKLEIDNARNFSRQVFNIYHKR